MLDCCSNPLSKKIVLKKHKCPSSGKLGNEVGLNTILHHIKQSWNWKFKEQKYYNHSQKSVV